MWLRSKIECLFKEPECAGNGIVGIAKNGVPIYNSVGGDCCDLALKVSTKISNGPIKLLAHWNLKFPLRVS